MKHQCRFYLKPEKQAVYLKLHKNIRRITGCKMAWSTAPTSEREARSTVYVPVMKGDGHIRCRKLHRCASQEWLHPSSHIYCYHFYTGVLILLSTSVQIFLKIHILHESNNDSNKGANYLMCSEQRQSLCCLEGAYHTCGPLSISSVSRNEMYISTTSATKSLGRLGPGT